MSEIAQLDARCARASKSLADLQAKSERDDPWGREAARLSGKREGVELVRSYIKEMSPPDPAREALLEIAALGRRAQNDPGAFVPRGRDEGYGGDYERLDKWQARALDAAIDAHLGRTS